MSNGRHRMPPAPRRPEDEFDDSVAELWILMAYDRVREDLKYDFGSGQRRTEIQRRLKELETNRGASGQLVSVRMRNLNKTRKIEALERVGRPRLERLLAETHRHGMPATERSIDAWRKIFKQLGISTISK